MWGVIKEIFFAIGSVAGLIAFIRPLFEDKLQRDQARVRHLREILAEQDLLNLEFLVWHSRRAPEKLLDKLGTIEYEFEKNHDNVRFTGPTAKLLSSALKDIVQSYRRLREYVQVPEWEPQERGGEMVWFFNKSEFENGEGIPEGYAEHLQEVAARAHAITEAYQRFQIVSELHILEVPLKRWLLARRIKAHDARNRQQKSESSG
jgi:hypothetical protein